jgi:hypothetical protein
MDFQRFNKVTGPWHALRCFTTHVETVSPPNFHTLLKQWIYRNNKPIIAHAGVPIHFKYLRINSDRCFKAADP